MDWQVWRIAWVGWCAFWATFWLVSGIIADAMVWGLGLFGLSILAMRFAIVPRNYWGPKRSHR